MIKIIKRYSELDMSIKIQKAIDLCGLWHRPRFFDLKQHQRIVHLNMESESKKRFENETGEIFRG